MTIIAIRFANILLASLVAGVMFGIWLGYNPSSLTASAYIEQQQSAIRALNVSMPVLGAICIALTLIHASLARHSRASFNLLLIGAALLIAAGLVTRFGNQPINAQVITWSATSPPVGWEETRNQWWQWHSIRTFAGLAALVCIIIASLRPIVAGSSSNRSSG